MAAAASSYRAQLRAGLNTALVQILEQARQDGRRQAFGEAAHAVMFYRHSDGLPADHPVSQATQALAAELERRYRNASRLAAGLPSLSDAPPQRRPV